VRVRRFAGTVPHQVGDRLDLVDLQQHQRERRAVTLCA
jgi:hypothetical protein